MSNRLVLVIGLAILISAYSGPLAALLTQLFQTSALLLIVVVAFCLMLVAPFRDR